MNKNYDGYFSILGQLVTQRGLASSLKAGLSMTTPLSIILLGGHDEVHVPSFKTFLQACESNCI